MADSQSTLGALYNEQRTLGWRTFNGAKQFGGEAKGTTVSEALSSMDLDFDVTTQPIWTTIDGVTTEIVGKQAIVRGGSHPAVYGITGPDYSALQNKQIAALLDPLTDQYGLDTVAAAANGRDLLVVLKAEPVEVNGDELQEYMWFQDSKDGIRAVKCMLTPVRLFCTNQLVTGLRAASFQAQIKHTEGVNDSAGFHLNIFKMMEGARRQLHESFEAMGKHSLTAEDINELLARVFPDPKVPGRVRLLHTLAGATARTDGSLDETFRASLDADQLAATDLAQTNYEALLRQVPVLKADTRTLLEKFNDQHSGYANTGWAFYNAVVELADFRGTKGSAENIAKSALFGDRSREKERAFSGVMTLLNPKWSTEDGIADTIAASSAVRAEARAKTRAAARLVSEAERETRRQAQYEADIASGKIKPRLDANGNILPPMTAEERLEAQILVEEKRLADLQARHAERVAALQAKRAGNTEALAARATAEVERAEAQAAVPAGSKKH